MASTLAGCGGGSTDGFFSGFSTTTTPATGGTASAGTTAADASNWKTLAPVVTVDSVTINSAPVVKFTVKGADGKGITGLGTKSAQSSTANVANLANIAFTLAKLVPGTNGAPSKWVSLNVLKPGTKTQQAAGYVQAATESCTSDFVWCGTYPTSDREGTMVDHGDGSYTYTFYRDPKLVKDLAATLVDSTNGLSKKADLGDLTYDATLTHRLGIQLGGNAPGVTPSIAMGTPANVTFDFRPDGSPVTSTRDIVKIDSCASCHDGKVLAHGSRKDPNYCVTCHTDQIKYSFSMEAPATGLALTGGVTGTTAQKRAEQAVVDGRAVGNFPNFMHKLHMGSKLIKTGYNYNVDDGPMLFNTVKTPGNVLNCTKCHSGATQTDAGLQGVKTTDGDNWKAVPSILACGSCHDGINFATGQGVTLADKAADVKAKVAVGTTQSGHDGGAKSNDASCALCHDAAENALNHAAKLAATADAAKRTMSATFTGVTVDATTGQVKATFTVTDGGVAVTDKTKFAAPTFMLAKLVKDANGVFNWVGYANQMNTKNEALGLVPQSKGEKTGTLVANADGSFTYTFALLGATAGDIRTVTHAHNVSSTGKYASNPADKTTANYLTFGDPSIEWPNPVAYEPTKTHRVAMTSSKAYVAPATAPATGAPGFEAWLDFVPGADGLGTGTVVDTRDISRMTDCARCHENQKLHAAYNVQVCVTCHNPGTKDPGTGETVALERLVHKLHMGENLPSVIAGGTYVVNVAHDYTGVAFPGTIKKCLTCHVNSTTVNKQGTNWSTNPTAAACATCHDSTATVNHAAAMGVGTCTVCHSAGKISDVKTAHGY
jgi:hypothetical protein